MRIIVLPQPSTPASIGLGYFSLVDGMYVYQESASFIVFVLFAIDTGGAIQVTCSDQTDCNALISQIVAAMLSTDPITYCMGNSIGAGDPLTPVATAGTDSISLGWSTPGTASNLAYNIYRSTDGVNFNLLAQTPYYSVAASTAETYVDANVVGGVTYYYKVQSVSPVAAGALVEANDSVTAAPGTQANLPASPGSLAAAPDYYQSDLSWLTVANATSYNIYRNGVKIGNTSLLIYNDSGITAGTLYSYTVTTLIGAVESAPSAAVTCTPNALAAPAGVAVVQGIYSAGLSWNPVAGATTYNLYRGTATGAEVLVQSGLTAVTFTDPALRYDTLYFYTVTAVANGGESPQSAEVSVQPNPATFTSAAPNPNSVNGGRQSFIGTGFDHSKMGQIFYVNGSAPITLTAQYISSTQINVAIPPGVVPGNVQFFYLVGGSSYQLPFVVAFG